MSEFAITFPVYIIERRVTRQTLDDGFGFVRYKGVGCLALFTDADQAMRHLKAKRTTGASVATIISPNRLRSILEGLALTNCRHVVIDPDASGPPASFCAVKDAIASLRNED